MRLSFLRFVPIIIVSVLCNYGCATDETKPNKVGQASQALIDIGGGCGGGGGDEDDGQWSGDCGGGGGGGDPGCDGAGGVADACGVCDGDGTSCGTDEYFDIDDNSLTPAGKAYCRDLCAVGGNVVSLICYRYKGAKQIACLAAVSAGQQACVDWCNSDD